MKKKLAENTLELFLQDSWERLPEEFKKGIKNIAFTVEEKKGDWLGGCWKMGEMFKIALYRKTLEDSFQRQIDNILVHEIAHYYGLDHRQISEMWARKNEEKTKRKTKVIKS